MRIYYGKMKHDRMLQNGIMSHILKY